MTEILSVLENVVIVFFSLKLYNNLEISTSFIPKEYIIDFNIIFYSSIIKILFIIIKNIYYKKQVKFNCFFGEEKMYLGDINENSESHYSVNYQHNKLYLRIKFKGLYKEIKKYKLIIQFPSLIDLNPPDKRIKEVSFIEEQITEEEYITKMIFDFSKTDVSDDKCLDEYKDITINFLLNTNEESGGRDFIYVKLIKKNSFFRNFKFKRLNSKKLKYNKVYLYRNLNEVGG